MDPVAPRGSPVPPAEAVPGQQTAPATVAANLPAATAAALGLIPGNTVDAQVLSALSAGRFLLAIGGRQVVAESASELRPGAKVRLDVTANDANGVFLRLVEPVRSDTSTPAQRLAQAGLPPTAVAAAVLAAFEDAGAPLDPRRLQAAVAAATRPNAPAATAAAHAALALAGLPATPALVALASRAVAGGTPNLAAAVQDLQRAVAAEPAVRSGSPAIVAPPGPDRAGTPIPPTTGAATSATPRPERSPTAPGAPTAPAAPTTPLIRTPTAPVPVPVPATASPGQPRTPATMPLLPAAPATGATTPPIVMAPPAAAANAVRPGQASAVQVAAATTVDAAPRTSILLATASTGPATGPRPPPAAASNPASLPIVPSTPPVTAAPEPRPSPGPLATVATPLVNRPNGASPALPTTATPPAATVAPTASPPATAPVMPAASPPGAAPVMPAAPLPANPPGLAMARPAPTTAPSPIAAAAGAPATPAAPAPAVTIAPTAVPPPATSRPTPASEAISPPPAATTVERPVMTRDQALLLLSRMSLPDPEQDGAPAVVRALQLAGVHPRATSTSTQAEPAEPPLARHLAAISAPAPTADREVAPAQSPPAPGTPALAAATTHAARESFAEQVFKPKEFADYDRVVPLPLAAQQVPTPARLAIASRSVGGGAQATFLRVDAELDRLGPVSVRVSGVSGGPLAITLIARPGAGGPLVEDLPDLVADLHKLGIEAGVRIAEDPARG